MGDRKGEKHKIRYSPYNLQQSFDQPKKTLKNSWSWSVSDFALGITSFNCCLCISTYVSLRYLVLFPELYFITENLRFQIFPSFPFKLSCFFISLESRSILLCPLQIEVLSDSNTSSPHLTHFQHTHTHTHEFSYHS